MKYAIVKICLLKTIFKNYPIKIDVLPCLSDAVIKH